MLEHKKLTIWRDFCLRNNILNAVPLFSTIGERVATFQYGKDKRSILQRSKEMDHLVVSEVEKVTEDFRKLGNLYDGLIYMMFWRVNDLAVPLYIGKSEKIGVKGGISENIKNIRRNNAKFCRWGYNYAYHMGDLSAVVCVGHNRVRPSSKYEKWAEKLFYPWKCNEIVLRQPTYFWIKAWPKGEIGIWNDYGGVSLTFLEYLLIGVASDLFPNDLLNREGVNRMILDERLPLQSIFDSGLV